MKTCKYEMPFPSEHPFNGTVLCGAYSESKLPNGKLWAHYPVCRNENCPLKHPELLGDQQSLSVKAKTLKT